MAVYTTGDLLRELEAGNVQCLADALVWWHGRPQLVADWCNAELGTRYTGNQVCAWRKRGVPAQVRWHAIATVVQMMMPGDRRAIDRIATVMER